MSNRVKNKIFVSYCKEDKKILAELKATLAPYLRDGSIILWTDELIQPGELWDEEIKKALNTSIAIIALISRYFWTSDYAVDHELNPMLVAAQEQGVKILWIATEKSILPNSLSKYQALNDPENSIRTIISNGGDIASAWVEIAEKIMEVISDANAT